MPRPSGSSGMKASRGCAPTRCRESPGRCADLAIISSRARPGASLRTSSPIPRRTPTTRPSLGADPLARQRTRVRAPGRLARSSRAHAGAAAALHVDTVSRPGRPAGVRHGAARPEPRAAVPHQPLCRRRPPGRRQRAGRGPHDSPPARRERQAIPRGDDRPALLLREPARRAAGRSAGERAAPRTSSARSN